MMLKRRFDKNQIFFYILIRSWNAFEYFDRCLDSVLSQSYTHYKILFIDDCSEYSKEQRSHITEKLVGHVVRFNTQRCYAVRNAYSMLHKFAVDDEAVVVNLDGDDWFFHKDVLFNLARIYTSQGCLLTYGECLLWNNQQLSEKPSRFLQSYTNIPYSKAVVAQNTYRHELFYPLHPRTWKIWLYKKIKEDDFKRPVGTWLQCCEDMAMFFPMLEMAHGRYRVIRDPLYGYNVATQKSDVKMHTQQLVADELIIRRKTPYAPLF